MLNRSVVSVLSVRSTKCDCQCVTLNPTWGKGYARKGAALHGARRFDEAIAAYEKGIEYEDSPALRKGLQEVKDAQGPLTAPTLSLVKH